MQILVLVPSAARIKALPQLTSKMVVSLSRCCVPLWPWQNGGRRKEADSVGEAEKDECQIRHLFKHIVG